MLQKRPRAFSVSILSTSVRYRSNSTRARRGDLQVIFMRLRTSILTCAVAWILSLHLYGTGALSHAESQLTVPPACQHAAANAVELVDCLQTQQEIVQHILDYEKALLEIDVIRQALTEPPPPAQIDESDSAPAEESWDSIMERVNWFDQNLEIYAIIGDAETRTAHARLEGREYRLRLGDQVRLATVVNIEPRVIYLAISGAEFAIGLSGTSAAAPTK